MQEPTQSTAPVPQRWMRPLDVEPGQWKKQLPAKILSIAGKGDVSALRRLLKEHPEYLNQPGNHNRTLLWEATRSGRLKAVQFLVEYGANVNTTGCYNSESHVQITPYVAALYYRRAEIAAYLKAQGSRLDIFRAAFLGDRRRVTGWLSRHPEWINAEDPHDLIYYMPLVAFAVAGQQLEMTRILLERGAQVAPYSAGLLYLAARVPRMDILELLTAHGADVRAVHPSIFVATPDLAVMRWLLQHGAPASPIHKGEMPALIYVARGDKGEHPEKAALLLDHGADINAAWTNGRTPLHYAAVAGYSKMTDLLLDRRADTTRVDQQGKTAADLARDAGKTAVTRLLARKTM